MSEQEVPGRALVQRTSTDLVMSDDEMRRTYRLAEALAGSGVWKDIKQAEAAMAKIVIGRDLGLTPAQAMQGVQLVEGAIQMHYSMLGQFIRARDGYDYRAGWVKVDREWGSFMTVDGELLRGVVLGEFRDQSGVYVDVRLQTQDDVERTAIEGRLFVTGAAKRVPQAQVRVEKDLSVVWLAEDDALDMRPVFGAVTVAIVDGETRGVSRFTEDDARQARLIKDHEKAAWNTSRRNMLLARSLSNLVKWSIPEVMAGMPVYVPGEIPEGRASKSLTAGADAPEEAPQGIDLGPTIDALIQEAQDLGHRGLGNRAMVEAAIGMRSPAAIKEWEGRARAELKRFKEARTAAQAAPETSVAAGDPEEEPVAEPEVEITGPVETPAEEPNAEPEPEDAQTVDDDPAARLRNHIEAEADRPEEE